MPAKHLFVFARGRNGWTETWYRNPPTINLDDEMGVALTWAKSRVPLLSSACTLDAIRVQDVGIKGSGFLNRDQAALLSGLVDPGRPDVRQLSLLCRAEADAGVYRRQVQLRGIPDDQVQYDAATGFEIFGDWISEGMQKLRSAFLTAGYGLRVISKNIPAGTAPERKIEDVSYTLAPGFVSVRVAGHGYAQLDAIRIRRAKFLGLDPGINAVWRVRLDVIPAEDQVNWFAVDAAALLPAQSRYWANGVVQIRQIQYRPLDLFTFERFAHRDTGSAFFRGRGRKRAIRRS